VDFRRAQRARGAVDDVLNGSALSGASFHVARLSRKRSGPGLMITRYQYAGRRTVPDLRPRSLYLIPTIPFTLATSFAES
jgi:predicted nucleic acid-binding Zn ribbon protein